MTRLFRLISAEVDYGIIKKKMYEQTVRSLVKRRTLWKLFSMVELFFEIAEQRLTKEK